MVLFPHQQSYHFFIVTSTCCPALIYRSWEATWHVYHMSSSRASYWLHYILYKFCISYQNKIRWDFFSYLMCIISCLFIWYVVFFSYFLPSLLIHLSKIFLIFALFHFYFYTRMPLYQVVLYLFVLVVQIKNCGC